MTGFPHLPYVLECFVLFVVGWLWAYREIKQRVSLPVVYFIKLRKYVFPGTSMYVCTVDWVSCRDRWRCGSWT